MSLALPTGRRGQLYALAGLALVLLLAWRSAVSPLLGWYDARAQAVAQQRALVAHLQVLVLRLPALEARARREAGQARNGQTATDARAGADLQQQIEAMATQAGTHIERVEFMPSEAAQGYRRIQLRITLTDRYPALISLLSAIEQADAPLFVDDLRLHAQAADGNPTPGAEMSFIVEMLRAIPAPRVPA